MVKIDVKNYKGFGTEFFVLPQIEKLLDQKRINLKNYLFNTRDWYNKVLFSLIDINGDGIPEKKFGKKFRVVYYKVKENNKREIKSNFQYNRKKVLVNVNSQVYLKEQKPISLSYIIMML